MLTVRESTAHLRFFHLIDEMLEGKYETIKADVLLVGPGRCTIGENKTYPQVDEVALILKPGKSTLHVIDNNKLIISDMRRRALVAEAWARFSQLNESIMPNRDISKLSCFLVQKVESMTCNTSAPSCKEKHWEWDPVKEDMPYSEITLIYTHIIATYSAFFYSEPQDFEITCVRLVRLLKNHGILYIDQASLLNKDLEQVLGKVGKTTESKLSIKYIPVAHRLKKEFLKDGCGRGIAKFAPKLAEFAPKYEEGDADRQVVVGSYAKLAAGMGLQTTDTCPVWAIRREIQPITELENSFSKATRSDYWFFLAKNHFKAFSSDAPKILNYEKTFGKDSYLRTSPQGWTPLHVAVLAGNASILQFFKEKGVPLDARDQQDKTCIDYAELYRPDLMMKLKNLQ